MSRHTHESPSQAEAAQSEHRHQHDLHQTEQRIESTLRHNPHDFKHVYTEINHYRHEHPKHFHEDLRKINEDLHKHGLLPKMQIVEDDHVGRHNRVHHGYDVIADDPSLKRYPGNSTIVSTSHHTPHESRELRNFYGHMHYQHGHYNGWDQSVTGGHGGDGGFDSHAVGGKVPDGARKELIDKALELAGVPVTAANEAAVNKIVTRESGWNPNITNHWDSNARAGHPSTGLMQTIPGTFHQYALPGYNTNINDPLSNLVAGIRYAQARYARNGLSGVEVVASRPGGY